MLKAIDLTCDLDGLVMLKDRHGHPTDEASQASFARLSDFRDGGIFAAHFSGSSGWERHPKGDEIVQILEGTTKFDIIVDDVMQSLELSAGMMIIVPQGCWHRFESDTGVKVLTATPQPTVHTEVDDPRTDIVED